MRPVTKITARKYRSASSRAGMSNDKKNARKVFRAKLRSSDRKTNFEGHVSPTYSNWDVI